MAPVLTANVHVTVESMSRHIVSDAVRGGDILIWWREELVLHIGIMTRVSHGRTFNNSTSMVLNSPF
jgi:uncharacterized protein YijF (DUF1287 family)